MAQTKRKRRTKHRGNAAGTIEARGRTGPQARPPTERSASKAEQSRQKRLERARPAADLEAAPASAR